MAIDEEVAHDDIGCAQQWRDIASNVYANYIVQLVRDTWYTTTSNCTLGTQQPVIDMIFENVDVSEKLQNIRYVSIRCKIFIFCTL